MKFESTIQYTDYFGLLDVVVFFSVLIITFIAIIVGTRSRVKEKESSLADYMIMGRSLTLPFFTATLVATWYGGIFGVTELAFNQGIYNFVTQGLFWYLTYIVFALFLVKKVSHFQALTLPDLVHHLFGPKSAYIAAIFNLFNVLPIAYSISLGLFIQALFGVEFSYAVVLGTLFVTLYSMFGGFRSVVYSDLVQFLVMCCSVAFVLFFSIQGFGGYEFLIERLPHHYFSLTGNKSLSTTLVWGLIAASTLVDPNFYQRCFAAKSPQVAKRGILVATMIWFCFDLCTTLGAMYARAVIPESSSKYAYLIYSLQLLPEGLRGFFLAGILATILSTLDSYLNIASNTMTYDFMKIRQNHRIWVARVSTVLVALITIVMAMSFEGSVKDVWKTIGSYSAGCLLLPMMVGFARPGFIKDKAFVLSTVCGVLGITYWRYVEHKGFLSQVDDLYIGVLCTSIGIICGAFFSSRA